MTEAEKKAEEMRKKDAEKLARRKKKFDAARFEHIEKTNQIYGQPKPQPKPVEPNRNEKEEIKRKGWNIFKKKPPKESSKAAPQAMEKKSPSVDARSVKPEICSTPLEIAPNWAFTDKQNARPQPNVGHSSDPDYMATKKIPKNIASTGSKKASDGPEPPKYNTVGYGTAGRKAGTGISSTIAAFQPGVFKPKTGDPRKMKQPKIETSTSESMDVRGNITRTITRKITDPNGKVRTETEVVQVPARR